jgi:hypothetical protein
MAFSSLGSAQNQGLETEPVSTDVPRPISRMSTLAYFLAPEVMSGAMKRIRPMRARMAERRL